MIEVTLGGLLGNSEPQVLIATLRCKAIDGEIYEFEQILELEQQQLQPDWDSLLKNPPYPNNPIRKKEDLYGRDSILSELEVRVSNETSIFLWGQKRVGKTSVLQVLAANLSHRSDIVCVVMRMGELVSLNEGQFAHRLASRIIEKIRFRRGNSLRRYVFIWIGAACATRRNNETRDWEEDVRDNRRIR